MKTLELSFLKIQWKLELTKSSAKRTISFFPQWSLAPLCRRCICEVAAGTTWASATYKSLFVLHMRRQNAPLLPGLLLGRIRTCAAGTLSHRSGLPPACLWSWTWVNFALLKTGMTNVAGHLCSHFGTVPQAVPAVMSQVHRRHMRTRLNRKITESRCSEHISLEAEFSTSKLMPRENFAMTWLKQHLKYFRNQKCHRLQNLGGNKIAAHDEKIRCNTF